MRVLEGRWRQLLALAAGVALGALMLLAVGVDPAESQSTPEQAKQADTFVDSIGVNVHLGYNGTPYWDNYPTVKQKLVDLGVRHVRDQSYKDTWQADDSTECRVYCRHKELAASGIKTNYIVDPRWQGMSTATPQLMAFIKDKAGSAMESVEGPNEPDQGLGADWKTRFYNYQRDLYNSTKGNTSTANVPVIVGGLAQGGDTGVGVGDLSAYADYANMHSYPGGNIPSDVYPGYDRLKSYFMDGARKTVPNTSKKIMATETGYHNAVNETTEPQGGQKGVSESAAGKYVPRTFLEYFNRGNDIARTYAYEFINVYPDPEKDEVEKNFGLLRNDATEKPAYTALKNLINLLKNQGSSFTPGSLDYSLSGDTTDVHKTLLQKRDGRFYLVLWQEVKSYDLSARQDVSVAPKRVTLNLGVPYNATVYRPSEASSAVAQSSGVSMALDVPDHPLVVELNQYCPAGQYWAAYWNNTTLNGASSLGRCETSINHNLNGDQSPASGIALNFSTRWQGMHRFEAGNYTFSATTDDGMRVWVDDELIIDQWRDQGATTYTASKAMTAGEHKVKVEYYDSGNAAVANVSWRK